MGAKGTAFILLAAGAWAQTEGSRICAGCHREIWEAYQRTGMGRSFYQPSPGNMAEDFTRNNTYYHAPSDSWFAMIARDGKYFQRRWQLNVAKQPINVIEKQIHYVMGSGNHARTYLHRTPADTLFELPLGWYAENGGYWAMNPGYDRPDHDGFRRPISYDCMFCHNAYPKIPAKPVGESVYSGPLPEGIDCARCHGSGARHAQLAGSRGVPAAQIRGAIVNPARLPAERQLDICMSCHLESTSFPLPNAIQRYGRGPFSFKPGEPLADFILNFDHAPGQGRDDKFEIVNAAYRLRRSACFLKSPGKLLCTTCHNPHDIPRGAAATQHYDATCRQCHSQTFDRMVASGKHTAGGDCASCHMPKRRTEDVVHVAVTDHLIQRHKPAGDLLAARAERQETGPHAYRGPVVLYYPAKLPPTAANELEVAVAQVKQGSNLKPGILQLQAAITKHAPARAEYYLDLAEALQKDGQLAKALPSYREAVRRNPQLPAAVVKLGSALRRLGQTREAVGVLAQATVLAPSDALAWHELGLAQRAAGKITEAVASMSKALERDPDLPEAHNNLGIIWMAQGAPARAESAFREAIRIRPDYADARGNLANYLAGAGRLDEAKEQFETALKMRPNDAPLHYNYAMLLGRSGQYPQAQSALEASLRADPKFADAHELLADLHAAGGNYSLAISHYREALKLMPRSASAHLGLGKALAATGDFATARQHLEQAASGTGAVRDEALALLRQLGPKR